MFCWIWNPAFYFGRNSRAYPVRIAVGSSKRSRAKEMKPRFGGAVIVAGVRVVVAACAAKHPHNAIIQKFLESGKKVMFHTKKRILSTTQQLKKNRKRETKNFIKKQSCRSAVAVLWIAFAPTRSRKPDCSSSSYSSSGVWFGGNGFTADTSIFFLRNFKRRMWKKSSFCCFI